jgi:hypothetical protein
MTWRRAVPTAPTPSGAINLSSPVMRGMLRRLAFVAVQTQSIAERFIALGADPVALAVLIPDRMKLTPDGTMEVTIERVLPDANRFPIPPDRYVIGGQGADVALIQALKPGTRATLEWKTTGFDWQRIDNVIGGGPSLVKAGSANVTATAEGFGPEFADKRHPRTAVGRTAAAVLG